jgi:hypothetical protein
MNSSGKEAPLSQCQNTPPPKLFINHSKQEFFPAGSKPLGALL